MREWSGKATWVIAALVVGTAVSTLLPIAAAPPSGTLRLGVLVGPGQERTARAVAPLAEYLGSALRRVVGVEVTSDEQLRSHPEAYDLALLPTQLVSAWPSAEVLAWANRCRPSGASCRPFVIFPRDRPWNTVPSPRVILGDRLTWAGGEGARAYFLKRGFRLPEDFGLVAYAANPYDHSEAIHALIHGAYDVAVAAEADVRAAAAAGLLDPARFESIAAGEAGNDFALVACASLPAKARRVARDAALNLDRFRFDPHNQRVAMVIEALQALGIEGFAPDVILPSLHP
jgi:ABC-type phosphate/phosphonate transport system substrate-binding protein